VWRSVRSNDDASEDDDFALFKDLKDSVNKHVAMTFHLPDGDTRKFSRATMTQQHRAYERLWNPTLQETDIESGCPSSRRIVQDILKFSRHLKLVREAKGKAVHELGDVRNGRRNITGLKKRGGKRVKEPFSEDQRYTHPDAKAALNIFVAKSLASSNV
jgi:hypothetical protein